MTLNLAEVERLWAIAETWLGTPWANNSEVRGARGGVACHLLIRAVLVEWGALSRDFPRLLATPADARRTGLFEAWLDRRPEFERVSGWIPQLVQPADVIGINWNGKMGHVGLSLGRGKFLHVLTHSQATIDPICDPTWSARIGGIWRLRALAKPAV